MNHQQPRQASMLLLANLQAKAKVPFKAPLPAVITNCTLGVAGF
jgi:hypothetical protein